MISQGNTPESGGKLRIRIAHSRLERAKEYIHKASEVEEDNNNIAECSPSPPPFSNTNSNEETTEDIAHLLTEIAEIAAKEVPLPVEQKKIRAVSVASPDLRPRPTPATPIGEGYDLSPRINTLYASPSVTPPESPNVNFRPPTRKAGPMTGPIEERSYDDKGPPKYAAWTGQAIQPSAPTIGRNMPKAARKVLHKKFSWKNYPELEEFLIANREEYLRHSTLNYTVQQKQYNNRLTERLLELAAECGYVFDEHDFSFVTVRDRIRCYYKSYVQSLKKRGIVIGYAARKAGLVTDQDLEKSVCTKGTIYVPSAMQH